MATRRAPITINAPSSPARWFTSFRLSPSDTNTNAAGVSQNGAQAGPLGPLPALQYKQFPQPNPTPGSPQNTFFTAQRENMSKLIRRTKKNFVRGSPHSAASDHSHWQAY